MISRDETIYYGDYLREATYDDGTTASIPLKDKNGLAVRFFDMLTGPDGRVYHVRKDEEFMVVLDRYPDHLIERLTPDIARAMERF